jgi:hypothetical protein
MAPDHPFKALEAFALAGETPVATQRPNALEFGWLLASAQIFSHSCGHH